MSGPALFFARIDANGGLHYENPQRARAFYRQRFADQRVDVMVALRGELKTRLQEAGFHAMIQPWAREEGIDIEDLKRDLLQAIFGLREHVDRITGEVTMVLRRPHTSKLPRKEYSELIERTLDIAATCGQVLEAPHEYRERKERERERASRKQKQTERTPPSAVNV